MGEALGSRVQDRDALAGRMALETAIASSLTAVVRRNVATGAALVRLYVGAAVHATLFGGPKVERPLPSDRKLVWGLCLATARVVLIGHVWRIGVRRRSRGAEKPGSAWSMLGSLRETMGDDVDRVDPAVARFFDAMDAFDVKADVHLFHRVGRVAAWAGTLLVGQGMYEEHLEKVAARFRLFRRDDGSLHFVREFWCADEVRVFDSDFVVRDVDGKRTILEVFTDLGIAARMRTVILEDGGVSMTVCGLFWRGVSTSPGPFRVCFETRPGTDGGVDVVGALDLVPRNRLEAAWLHRVLGLPARVGDIRYFARLR